MTLDHLALCAGYPSFAAALEALGPDAETRLREFYAWFHRNA